MLTIDCWLKENVAPSVRHNAPSYAPLAMILISNNVTPLSTHIHDPHIETRPQPTSLMDADTDTTGQEIPIKIKIGLNVTLSSISLVLTCNMPETKWCLQQTAAHFLLMT